MNEDTKQPVTEEPSLNDAHEENEAAKQNAAPETNEETVVEVTTVTIPQTELEQLKQQVEENQARYLRAQADLDNFRRRTRMEKEELAKYASAKVLEAILPAIDNFERALSSSKQTADFDALIKGLEMVYRQLEQTLEQEGLTAIQAVGQPFNPEFHQAVVQMEVEGMESGLVVEELQKGYLLKDKVIRPSMVKVSQ